MNDDEHRTPAQERAVLLGDDTITHLRDLAEQAPPLTEQQRDIIRAAFRRVQS